MCEIILQKEYSQLNGFYQLKLPLNIECMIPNNDSVRLLSQCIEEMDLTELYQTYSRIRENQASPRQLLKIVLYAYMNHIYSSRQIESSCRRDINFHFLLEGRPAPDHATIARFISMHFSSVSESILSKMTHLLKDCGEISCDAIFIDGTKIEATSNKYSFVWKRTVTKNLQKMMNKIPSLFALCENEFGIKVVYQESIKLYHLKKLYKKLRNLQKKEDVVFVYGSGKRKSKLQKATEQLEVFIQRLKAYTKHLHILGNRNSYSKTDHDATFMRMKEDAMKNGQLKPAYNLQFGVDSEYVTWISIGPQPTDTTTLIPFLTTAQEKLGFKYRKVIADAGYESEENYAFLESNHQLSYIKPANYELSKTRKYQKDISRIETMNYDETTDSYVCKNGKRLVFMGERVTKTKTGYRSLKSRYVCEDCSNCEYKTKCIKGNNCKTPFDQRTKHLETSKAFQLYRKQDLERIITPEGCQLRMNRSIQAEGAFAQIKQDMQFRRFLFRGTQKVLAQCILLGIAQNFNKLHNKIQSDRCGMHLHPMNS